MDGVHDLGGMQGFGPVVPEPDEPAFHQPWEARTHGLVVVASLALRGLAGPSRRHIEAMGHAEYLTTSYYEHWLAGLEARLVAAGVVEPAELAARQADIAAGTPVPRRPDPDTAAFVRTLFRPRPIDDPEGPAPWFAVGDAVTVRRMRPAGHTRCPRYVRGCRGTVEAVRPAQPLPDRLAEGEVVVEPFYSVAFAPTELWGDDAEPGAGRVVVDLWESYLERPG